jgi:hypothetical protein
VRTTLVTMLPVHVLHDVSPYGRVLTAVAPFLAALVLRLIFGKNMATRALLSISVFWFAANIFVAPYSYSTRQDLVNLRRAVLR